MIQQHSSQVGGQCDPQPSTFSKAAPGTPILVDIIAETDPKTQDITFHHQWGWETGNVEGTGRIEIPPKQKHEPGTEILFVLHDMTRPRKHLEFADDPMWVRRGGCPAADTPCEDKEIPPSKFKRAAKVLKVFDENEDDCVLHYRLWFADKNGNPETYDPDIKNGGTST